MASLAYLQLDAQYDPLFSDGSSFTGTLAVAQAILTRLKLFTGEWWEDLTLGLPVFQSMLGRLASQRGLAAIELLLSQNIQDTPYVTGVTAVNVDFADGQFTFKATAQTTFGTVTVSSNDLPGASASLGS